MKLALSLLRAGQVAALAFAASTALFTACSKSSSSPEAPPSAGPTELTVFAAASLTDVLAVLAPPFEEAHEAKITYNFAGSNTLAQQIAASPNGADVFLSASEKWMDFVEDAGHVAADTRQSLLSNSLVIIANRNSPYRLDAPLELPNLGFKYLSLGNPDAVPAGRYAKKWLQGLHYQDGSVWDAVSNKVSPAPDVRAALGQVEGSEDVVGIVYHTDYAGATDRVRLIYALPAAEGPQISYAAAVLKEAAHPTLAKAYLDYLHSTEAVKAFERAGFTVLGQK